VNDLDRVGTSKR